MSRARNESIVPEIWTKILMYVFHPGILVTVFYIIICRDVISAEALRLFLRPLRCLCGASAVPLRLFLRPLRCLCGCFCSLCGVSAVVSAASAAPLRFYVGILFHVQIDLNFTSNSTSILRPIRSQFYGKLLVRQIII